MFSNYAILANYSWLLVEAHFLFTLVSCSFFSLRKHLTWYLILSWGTKSFTAFFHTPTFTDLSTLRLVTPGLPGIVIVLWGCAKYFYEDEG